METNARVWVVATMSTATFNATVILRIRHGLSNFISTEKWFVIDRTHQYWKQKYLNISKLQFEVYNSLECLNIISNQQSQGNYFFIYLLWISLDIQHKMLWLANGAANRSQQRVEIWTSDLPNINQQCYPTEMFSQIEYVQYQLLCLFCSHKRWNTFSLKHSHYS